MRSKHSALSARRFPGLIMLALLAAAVSVGAATDEDDPVLWPERQRAFLMDGPGLLLEEEERTELLEAGPEERDALIDKFLDRDPDPETELNELHEAIRRRRALAASEVPTFLDARARALFLHGTPTSRTVVECGSTFVPLEIWVYGGGDEDQSGKGAKRQLVLYRPAPKRPYRVWLPLDSKRALYTDEMTYYLMQWEELRGMIRAKRFDLQTCDETPLVDDATGVAGLRDGRRNRPTVNQLRAFMGPPEDVTEWARTAAATPLEELPGELPISAVDVLFPEQRSQRIVTRVLLTLPRGTELGIDVEDEEKPEHRLSVVGTVEQDGQLFEDFRIRYRIPTSEEDVPLALEVERALRPQNSYLLRLQVIDEVGGGERAVARGMLVPLEPTPIEELPVPEETIVAMGEQLATKRLAGRDSLLLAPPIPDVIIGTWRAETIVTGENIEKVVFLVDDVQQLTKSREPFSVELRLAEYPREQTVRAEGYDGEDNLLASDEVVLNQPRGQFKVSIVEPKRGTRANGEVDVRAEVVVPEERRIETVEFLLNDEPVEKLLSPPWRTRVEVPGVSEFSYVTAVAVLDDGTRVEDVRYVNAPEYLEEVEVDLVELLTTVLDSSGRPVEGLAREDFAIFEDGRAQDVTKFEIVRDLPLSLGIAIDTSGSMASALHVAKEAAAGFLDRVVTRRDKVFALAFSDKPNLLIPATDDVRAVEAALEDLQSVGWTALHDAVVSSLYYFRGVRGRRALILLSDGDDTVSYYPYRDVLEYSRRSGVVIYSIGVGSLRQGLKKKLTQLADETGGRSFFIKSIDNLFSVYQQIESELRSQYLLTYHSDNDFDPETFRAVDVKVRKGRLKARTLRGYYP